MQITRDVIPLDNLTSSRCEADPHQSQERRRLPTEELPGRLPPEHGRLGVGDAPQEAVDQHLVRLVEDVLARERPGAIAAAGEGRQGHGSPGREAQRGLETGDGG